MKEWIAGVDEAGRGPLAGAVVAAAVILPPGCVIAGLTDSKKLTAARREALFIEIHAKAIAIGVGRADPAEIDRINILQATLVAMQRAVASLSVMPQLVLIDGNRCPSLACQARAIVGGDLTEPLISAASIIAKVTRDREMLAWHDRFPQYGFDRHKGYGTEYHRAALLQHGACEIHRRSFAPVAAVAGSA